MDNLYYELGRAMFWIIYVALAGGVFGFGKALVRKLFDIDD